MKSLSVKAALSCALMLLCLSVEAWAQAAAGSGNWPQWRGPNRDGISRETGLLKQWPTEGPPLVWKATGAGRGYSSLAVADNRIYTMGLRGDREFIVAFDVTKRLVSK